MGFNLGNPYSGYLKLCLHRLHELRHDIEASGFNGKRDGVVLERVYDSWDELHLRRPLFHDYVCLLDTAQQIE